MNKIIQYLKEHLQSDWNAFFYALILAFMGVWIYFNYFLFPHLFAQNMGFERWLVSTFCMPRSWWAMPVYFLFYAFPYFSVVGIMALLGLDVGFMRKKEFWIKSIFALLLLSANATTLLYADLTASIATGPERYWALKTVATAMPILYVGIPLFSFWMFWERRWLRTEMHHFYGLRFKGFDWKPYATILFIALPFLFAASFLSSFNKFYPTLKLASMQGFSWMPTWLGFVVYEIAYGLRYLWTEVMMRGFLVVGLAAVMGRNAILPMVALYATVHFAKPMGETISSVFGGYVLGVIALRSNNIMGGFWIHAGVAVMMDVMAFGQQVWR